MFKHLISIEERRVSALILGFILTLLYCMIIYVAKGKLDNAWVDILQAIIAGVVGVGGVNALRDWATKYNPQEIKKGDIEVESGV